MENYLNGNKISEEIWRQHKVNIFNILIILVEWAMIFKIYFAFFCLETSILLLWASPMWVCLATYNLFYMFDFFYISYWLVVSSSCPSLFELSICVKNFFFFSKNFKLKRYFVKGFWQKVLPLAIEELKVSTTIQKSFWFYFFFPENWLYGFTGQCSDPSSLM